MDILKKIKNRVIWLIQNLKNLRKFNILITDFPTNKFLPNSAV